MVLFTTVVKVALIGLAASVTAHPGHEDHVMDRAVKRSFLAKSKRSLDSCAEHFERRGTLKRAEERRRAYVKSLAEKSAGMLDTSFLTRMLD